MKSFLSVVGAVVVMGAFGCGTTVNVIGDDGDGTGGSGEGGGSQAGTGGADPGPTPTSTSSGPQPPPPNPPDCPALAPTLYGECSVTDLACNYLEEQGCTVAYVCVMTEDCYGTTSGAGGYDGGYGGYGDCYAYGYWQPTSGSCVPAAVDCGAAHNGDVCAVPGESCGGSFDDCTYTDKWCNEDHLWEIYEYYDECCGDDCCYDDCCEPYYCPESPPEPGDSCDPCFDSEYCGYEYEDPYCGYTYVDAYCDPYTYTWQVYGEGCSSTSVSVSSTGVGGGWEGTGGAGF